MRGEKAGPIGREKIETAITIALIALAGALFVPFATHRLSLWRDNRARLLSARANFRAAFSVDIVEITNRSRQPEIYVYLAKRFSEHATAVRELSAQLSRRQRRYLTKDWETYGKDVNELRQRYNTVTGHPDAEARRKLAVERLEKVISHANET